MGNLIQQKSTRQFNSTSIFVDPPVSNPIRLHSNHFIFGLVLQSKSEVLGKYLALRIGILDIKIESFLQNCFAHNLIDSSEIDDTL